MSINTSALISATKSIAKAQLELRRNGADRLAADLDKGLDYIHAVLDVVRKMNRREATDTAYVSEGLGECQDFCPSDNT